VDLLSKPVQDIVIDPAGCAQSHDRERP
jgi:hypothetical protein